MMQQSPRCWQKHLFKTISALQKSSSACSTGDNEACSANILEIVASFAAVGEYITGTVGQCQRATGALASRTKEELCAGAIQGLVHHTAKAAEAGINLKGACSAPAPAPMPMAPARDTVVIGQQTRLYAQ